MYLNLYWILSLKPTTIESLSNLYQWKYFTQGTYIERYWSKVVLSKKERINILAIFL